MVDETDFAVCPHSFDFAVCPDFFLAAFVHIRPMSYFDHDHYKNAVIDFIDYPVRTQPRTVAILAS